MKTRVKEYREAKGWSQDMLADISGVSKSQISRIENEERNWSVESLTAIATAFGTTPEKLLDLADTWVEIPLFGIVLDGAFTTSAPENSPPHKVPMAYAEALAFRVDSDSLFPRYQRGEYILCQKEPVEPRDVIGRECFVVLTNGRSVIRTVNAGTRPLAFHLSAHNQPQIDDASILICRPTIRF